MLRVRKTTNIDLIRKLDAEIFFKECEDACGGDYDDARYVWWVAYQDGEPIGFAGLKVLCEGSEYGYLCRAGVSKVHRGNGLQRKFIKVREAECKRRGLSMAITYTEFRNHKSANNLIRCGWTLYRPELKWGYKNALYFWKHFKE